jgi:glycosyltransferase involved in cell wall biosynthesis
MRIIHVTPHLGGGVGRVLLNYLRGALGGSADYAVYCLEDANEGAARAAAEMGLELHERLGRDYETLASAAATADAAVIHWWNHPLLYAWMINGLWPECRLLLWSHVAGHHAPQVFTENALRFPDLFALTTPHSLAAPALAALSGEERAERVRVLFQCGGLDYVPRPAPRPADGRLRIGYVGTVEGQKMNPRFLDLCLAADLPPEAVFVVAGGPGHEELRQAAADRGAAERFEILGPVDDVPALLVTLDVFGYPLSRTHYGALELALLEAQAAGVPPVVLGGGAESFLVRDGITGLAAAGEADYSQGLGRLARDPELRKRLAAAAAEDVRQRFSLENTVAAFDELYAELLARPKRLHRYGRTAAAPLEPYEIFLESQGGRAEDFRRIMRDEKPAADFEPVFFSPTRGSVFHYQRFFPDDPRLAECGRRLRRFRAFPGSGPGAKKNGQGIE